MYRIRYNTGAGDETAETLEAAKSAADEGASHTQQPIVIEDEFGNEVARRQWWGVSDGWKDENDPIRFGEFGFYGDWQED